MNPRLLVNVVSIFTSIAPKIKGWIFADGKFQPTRAAVILIALAMLMLGTTFMEPEEMKAVTDALDDVSDMIGYAEQ